MDVDNDRSAAEGERRILCLELRDPFCKGIVGNLLEVLIDREHDGVALLRLLDVFRGYIAIVVRRGAFYAIRAAQVFLHCLLDPVFADGIALEVALVLIFLIFGLADRADHTEDVRRERPVDIFAVRHHLDFNAPVKIALLLDLRNRLSGYVFRKGVGRALTEHQAVHLIINRGYLARLLRRIFLKAVFFNERVQAILRGSIAVDVQDLVGLQVGHVAVPILRKGDFTVCIEDERKIVNPLFSLGFQQLDQADDNLVALLDFIFIISWELLRCKNDGISLPVGHEGIAVAVQNLAARCFYPCACGADGLALFGILCAIDELQLDKAACKEQQENAQQTDGDNNAGSTFVLIHQKSPSFLVIREALSFAWPVERISPANFFHLKSEKTQRLETAVSEITSLP